MKIIFLMVLTMVIDGLIFGGEFRQWVFSPDYWLLMCLPILIMVIGSESVSLEEANGLYKYLGSILIILPIIYYICFFCSSKFRNFVCESTGLSTPGKFHDISWPKCVLAGVVDLIILSFLVGESDSKDSATKEDNK